MPASATALALEPSGAVVDGKACRHCGDPCRAGGVSTGHGVFCCAGCEAVYTLIATHGLTAYYTCPPSAGATRSAPRADDRAYAAFDDPIVVGRLTTRLADGRVRATLSTPTLHCASCVWLLEQLWRFDPGIARSEAHLTTRRVTVEFSPDQTSLGTVARRLAALGYPPVVDAEIDAGTAPAVRRRLYLQLGVAGFAFGNVMLFSIPAYVNGGPLEPEFQRLFGVLNLVFSLPVLVVSAADFFRGAWAGVRARTVTLDVPIAIGLIALYGRSVSDIASGRGEGFLDSFAGLVFFLLIGRLFQQKAFEGLAFDRTVRSFVPLSVQVEQGGGLEARRIDELAPGDTIRLRPQEVVPADATLVDEAGLIDYAFATGEATPVPVRTGETVEAGGRVVGRALRLRVVARAAHSRLATLWAHPVFGRPKARWLSTILMRFGQAFTVLALVLAAAGAVAWWPDGRKAAEVATAVLIIACPCAFTLAAPITLGTAMGVLGRAGLFLKQPDVALDLSRIDTIAFDKTGTLTTAAATAPVLSGLDAASWDLVRRLASQSVHPVSRAIAAEGFDRDLGVTDARESAGGGVSGLVDGHTVAIGSAAFVAGTNGDHVRAEPGVTWASIDAGPPAPIRLVMADRTDAVEAAERLSRDMETWLVTGDHAAATPAWATLFGDRALFRQTPEQKLELVRRRQAAGRRVLMVGDGLNDAGALTAADVGLAVSDDTACLVPACDAIVRGGRLAKLPAFLAYARRARRVILACFAVSLAYNAIGLTLALGGHLTPLVTAILMPVSSLSIVGLAAGLMRWRTQAVLA